MTTDWTRLRQIMYEPSACWLATEYSGDRWLTDQYVLYNVTDMDELKAYEFHLDDCTWEEKAECSCPDELPDGAYKVTVSKGFQPRKSVPQPDIEAYFSIMASLTWYPARPSEWSVAEHPGKAMLWKFGEAKERVQYDDKGGEHYLVTDGPYPALLGESTWSAIKKHYPDCVVEHAFNRKAGVFRFSELMSGTPYETGTSVECDQYPVPFAYAAGIQIPEGQEAIAHAIAQALDSTSNGQEVR